VLALIGTRTKPDERKGKFSISAWGLGHES